MSGSTRCSVHPSKQTSWPAIFRTSPPISSKGADGVVVLTPRVTAASLAENPDLLAIARFGVGYDTVDVDACTAANVLLFIASGAVDRPVAEATVGWMIALSHHVRTKDRLVREARWDDRSVTWAPNSATARSASSASAESGVRLSSCWRASA